MMKRLVIEAKKGAALYERDPNARLPYGGLWEPWGSSRDEASAASRQILIRAGS